MSEQEIKSQQQQGQADITEFVDPFPGLRPFGIEESHLFFGREGQSDEVLMKLSENKFVGILGASGSGKSSLMYCGLIPTLYGGFMTQAGSNWRIVVTRPGGGPIDNLAEALLKKDKQYNECDDEEQLIRKTITSTVLRASSLGLIEAVKQLKSSDAENVLVLVDQFEELFRYKKLETLSSDLDESSAFVNLLLEAVHQYDAPIYVALTMRSDFIGDCATFPDLTQIINDSHYLIPQMTRDQKRLAIEGPVAVGGGKIAPRLTQQLLNDVGDNPDQLPILQHALMRTWQFWKEHRREGEPMDLKHYNAIGTLREALSQHANEAYDSLSKREQQICEAMFKALTERGTETSGIRRPTKLATIAAIAGVNEEEVIRVVDKFREPGRTLLMPPYGVRLESDTVVDISHESLMRIWTRLKSWLDEESRSAEMYLKLSESAERFQLGRAGLWKMPDLQLALNWQEENKPTLVWGQRYEPAFERTMVFLETSKKAYETEQRNKELLQKRALKRSRIVAIVLAGAMLISIFFVVYSQIQAAEAEKQKALAEQLAEEATALKDQAEAEKENAQRQAAEARRQEGIALREKEAADIERQKALDAQKLAEEQTQLAIEAQALAQANAEEAQKNAELAQKQSELAEQRAEEARLASNRAQRLRFQAIANSMAIKSKAIEGNAKRQGVIAKQAWLYNNQYGEKTYNADVYSGVYYAYKNLMLSRADALEAADDGEDSEATKKAAQKLREWNLFEGHNGAVRSVIYNKAGTHMYSAGSDGLIYMWDLEKTERIPDTLVTNGLVNRVVDISPDERYLAVAGDHEDILLYNTGNLNSPPKEVSSHHGAVYSLVFLKDNSGFVSASGDKVIRRNDYNSSEEVARVTSRVKSLAISPDGRYVAGGAEDGRVYLWDFENGYEETSLYNREGQNVESLAFSEDDKWIAIGYADGNIIIWDIKAGRIIKTLTGHGSHVRDLEFNADHTLLVSTSHDGTARIWVMAELNDLPIVLDDHGKNQLGSKRWVFSATFSPDGKSIVTGAGDGHIRLWPIKPDGMAEEICGMLDQNMTQNDWEAYVANDIDYVLTCDGLPKGSED